MFIDVEEQFLGYSYRGHGNKLQQILYQDDECMDGLHELACKSIRSTMLCLTSLDKVRQKKS